SAVALPLSAIPTFWAMSLLGFSLNLVSLLGITLGTGILVVDAIVEIDNIVRHMRSGKSPYRAALEAADEVGLAVSAISLALVARLGLFPASIYATTLLPTGFLPDEDTSRIVASVELPPGATLDSTRATTDGMVDILKTIPEVRSVFVLGGTTPTGGLELRKASLFVHLAPKTERTLPQKRLKTIISNKLADVPDTR